MSSSSRNSAPSPPAIKVRKRASTKVLLEDDPKELPQEILEPPKPLQNAANYDRKRIGNALLYVDSTLRNPARKLSPIGMRALLLYKDACTRFLEMEVREMFDEKDKDVQAARAELIATIRNPHFTACLKVSRSPDAQTLQDELLKLQRTAFYARYGDLFAVVCRQLKHEAEAKKVEGWQSLHYKYWTEIDQKIQQEKAAFQKVLDGENLHDQCVTHIAISHACDRVGFNMDDMILVIHRYAVRNELLHSNLVPMIKNGRYDDLKRRLYSDFCDVPLIISVGEKVQLGLMLKLIETMIQLWFDRDSEDFDNIQMWTPSTELKEFHRELKGSRSEGELNKEMFDAIMTSFQRGLRESEQEKEMAVFLLSLPLD
ncbi:hypothetical protein MMC31_007143 [Peltigera leucophlebia]|nr:hypothetical protein [Peltigera leucophlebia]